MLIQITLLMQTIFYVVGMLVLFLAGITAVVQYILSEPWDSDRRTLKEIEWLRVSLGQKIVLALEFFVIADALATVLRPSLDELYRVALIVAVRTVLSFFISRELTILHEKDK